MKQEIPNAALAAGSAAVGTVALFVDGVTTAIFGVPLVLLMGCFAGALFGATFFPPDSKISRPWAVLINTMAGVFLSAMAFDLARAIVPTLTPSVPVKAGVGFFVATSPLFVVRWFRQRVGGSAGTGNPPGTPDGN